MPAGWALPGALRCILVLQHPASRHVQAAQLCQPRCKPGLAPSAPSPALLCQEPGCGHPASSEEGVMARAASRGLGRGAHRAWTRVRQRRGDTQGHTRSPSPHSSSWSFHIRRQRTVKDSTRERGTGTAPAPPPAPAEPRAPGPSGLLQKAGPGRAVRAGTGRGTHRPVRAAPRDWEGGGRWRRHRWG